MKKIVSIIMITIIMLCSSGCWLNSDYSFRRKEQKFADQIFKCLQDEDADSLEDLFSESVSDNNDIEDEFDVFFDSIDGRIESYDHVNITVCEKYVDHFQVTRAVMHVVFYDIVTDSGTEYDYIVYYRVLIDDSNPDEIGLYSIRLFDNDSNLDVYAGGNEE